MRFLVDESCDYTLVKVLREAGHDVLAVSETTPGAEDSDVIQISVREKRILLTEDKDFGQLVYAHGQSSVGVIFLRFPFSARTQISRDLSILIEQQGERLSGCFVTIQPNRIRISHIPRG
jgi:predicted nuclease of predicted toxin-antitoxin system